MRVASTLLLSLAQPLGGDLEIPDAIMPVASLQYPAQGTTFNVPVDGRGATGSFGISMGYNQGPAAAAQDILAFTFDKGTYDLHFTQVIMADFTQAVTVTPGTGCYLLDPGGTAYILLSEMLLTTTQQLIEYHDNFTFSRSGWQLRFYGSATAAAQNLKNLFRAYIRQLI